MSNGWASISNLRVVKAAGANEKVKVWTTQVIVTLKFFVMKGTVG